MLVLGLDICLLTKVDSAAITKDSFAIPNLTDSDGGIDIEEGNDDATERLERRKGVDRCYLGNQSSDSLQVVWSEDICVVEAGKEEGI